MTIRDEFSDRPITRQRKYQLRKERDGTCTHCGHREPVQNGMCIRCRLRMSVSQSARIKKGLPPLNAKWLRLLKQLPDNITDSVLICTDNGGEMSRGISFQKYRKPGWDGVLVSVCARCGKIYDAKDAKGVGDNISHGSCAPCLAEELAAMDRVTLTPGRGPGREPKYGFAEFAPGEQVFFAVTAEDAEKAGRAGKDQAEMKRGSIRAALYSRRKYHPEAGEEWKTELAEKAGRRGVLVTRRK